MNECTFCAEQCSTAIQDSLVLAHTDCKGMDLCPIRAFFKEKPSSFDKPAPKLNSPYQATSSRQKVAHSLYRSAILKKSSDRTHRI